MPRSAFCLFFLLLFPEGLWAQSYAEIRSTHPDAIETTVTAEHAYVYDEPALAANIVGRFRGGTELLAYEKMGDFYAVATPRQGHVGYMLLTALAVPQVPGAAVAPAVRQAYKDPRTATLTSLVFPGGGHIYAGEATRGFVLFGLSAGAFGVGYALSDRSREFVCDPENVFDCEQTMDRTPLLVGSAVAVAAWAYGIFDAGRAARRVNERSGATVDVGALPLIERGVRPALAVRVRW